MSGSRSARAGRRLAGDDGAREDARPLADGGAVQDRCGVAEHGACAYANRACHEALEPDRALDVADVVVEVDEHDIVAEDGAGADLDRFMGCEHASIAEDSPFADPHLPARNVEPAPLSNRAAVLQHDPCPAREVEDHPAPQTSTALDDKPSPRLDPRDHHSNPRHARY